MLCLQSMCTVPYRTALCSLNCTVQYCIAHRPQCRCLAVLNTTVLYSLLYSRTLQGWQRHWHPHRDYCGDVQYIAHADGLDLIFASTPASPLRQPASQTNGFKNDCGMVQNCIRYSTHVPTRHCFMHSVLRRGTIHYTSVVVKSHG
jgi:hypothetical protein